MSVRKRQSAPTVHIRANVLVKISKYRQQSSEAESGGILLGEFFPTEDLIRIMFVSIPGKSDVRSMFAFRRDAERSTRIAQAIWKRSGGSVHYLGEWHTHPEAHPNPSCSDRLSMGRLLQRSTVVSGGLILIILGRQSDYFGFYSKSGSSRISVEIAD